MGREGKRKGKGEEEEMKKRREIEKVVPTQFIIMARGRKSRKREKTPKRRILQSITPIQLQQSHDFCRMMFRFIKKDKLKVKKKGEVKTL